MAIERKKSIDVEVGGRKVTVRRLGNRQSLRASWLLRRMIGDFMIRVLSGRIKDEAGNPVQLELGNLAAITKSPTIMSHLLGNLLNSLEDVEPEEIGDLADRLLVGHVTYDGTEIEKADDLDEVIPDMWQLVSILRHSIALNMLPTMADESTSAASSAEKTSRKPADTSPQSEQTQASP
jgi:hypothetical protein